MNILVNGWNSEDWIAAVNNAIKNKDEIIKKQNERKRNYLWENIISDFYDYLGI